MIRNSAEPIAWIAGPVTGQPTNQMERDVIAFQRNVDEAREHAGTDAFWAPFTEANRLHSRWWRRGLGLMSLEKMESLKRFHFNELYMPENSRASRRFWEVYNEVENLMYPDRQDDGTPSVPDDGKIREAIADLHRLYNNCLQQNGRAICGRTIILTIERQHEKEAKKRRKSQVTFRACNPVVSQPLALRATGS